VGAAGRQPWKDSSCARTFSPVATAALLPFPVTTALRCRDANVSETPRARILAVSQALRHEAGAVAPCRGLAHAAVRLTMSQDSDTVTFTDFFSIAHALGSGDLPALLVTIVRNVLDDSGKRALPEWHGFSTRDEVTSRVHGTPGYSALAARVSGSRAGQLAVSFKLRGRTEHMLASLARSATTGMLAIGLVSEGTIKAKWPLSNLHSAIPDFEGGAAVGGIGAGRPTAASAAVEADITPSAIDRALVEGTEEALRRWVKPDGSLRAAPLPASAPLVEPHDEGTAAGPYEPAAGVGSDADRGRLSSECSDDNPTTLVTLRSGASDPANMLGPMPSGGGFVSSLSGAGLGPVHSGYATFDDGLGRSASGPSSPGHALTHQSSGGSGYAEFGVSGAMSPGPSQAGSAAAASAAAGTPDGYANFSDAAPLASPTARSAGRHSLGPSSTHPGTRSSPAASPPPAPAGYATFTD